MGKKGNLRSILCLLLVILTWDIHASECEQEVADATYWKSLEASSQSLSYYLCKLSDATKPDDEATTIMVKEAEKAYIIWRQELIRTAVEIDGLIKSSPKSGTETDSILSLVDEFIWRVDNKVSYLMFPENIGAVNKNSQRGYPTIDFDQKGDTPSEMKHEVSVGYDNTATIDGMIIENLLEQSILEECKQKMSVETRGACIQYLDEWTKKASLYKYQLVKKPAAEIVRLSMEYSKEWERFYDEGRAQTFIDTAYTAKRYSNVLNKPEFVMPPEVQYFLFRPSIVMEYVDDEPDGNKFKEALAFELYGFNYWDGCDWLGMPCGASVVTTFSDRAIVDDYSFGLMFHIKNHYSIAVTKNFGDNDHTAVFVTVDLLKALESKKERFKDWKNNIDDITEKYKEQIER